MRAIAGLKYNDHTETYFKKIEILPMPTLIKFFLIQFIQHFVQKFLPAAFDDTWTTNAIRREGQSLICLRNDNNLFIPPARLSQTDNHPLKKFPRKWRALLMFTMLTSLETKRILTRLSKLIF
jgi:hypothetical protein